MRPLGRRSNLSDVTLAKAPPAGPGVLTRLRQTPTFYPLLGLVAVCIVMVVATDSFLSVSNISNVLRQVSINALIAVGMTYVILTGGIDLSVGAVMALSGTLMAGMMAAGVPGALAILAALLIGIAFGVANGGFVALAGMPPIIVTLATMGIARGLALSTPAATRSAACRPGCANSATGPSSASRSRSSS